MEKEFIFPSNPELGDVVVLSKDESYEFTGDGWTEIDMALAAYFRYKISEEKRSEND